MHIALRPYHGSMHNTPKRRLCAVWRQCERCGNDAARRLQDEGAARCIQQTRVKLRNSVEHSWWPRIRSVRALAEPAVRQSAEEEEGAMHPCTVRAAGCLKLLAA